MIAIDESAKETSYTFVKGDCDNRPIVASDDENSCSSTDDQREDVTKKNNQDGKTTKVKVDTFLLRQTTASIADALLKLGGTEDDCDASSCNYSSKNRKRSVSVVADTDASSTGSQSTDSETDISSTVNTKRQRKTPSQALFSIPTKLCLVTRTKSPLHDFRQSLKFNPLYRDSEEQASTSSTSKFQMEHKEFNDKKVPGEIGSISQSFHEGFRPLAAAPRLPKGIIAEFPPPLPQMQSPYIPLPHSGNMYSSAFTEHDDFLIMHSYTVLPRTIPHHMARVQLPTWI